MFDKKYTLFLRDKREEIYDLIARAEDRAQALRAQPSEFVLCHSDVHAGNILIASSGRLYIVDWDEPILAPKERDLMFVGGGQGFVGCAAEEEEALFYRGYGQTLIDRRGLAYYRFERIIQDIAAYCEQLLLNSDGGKDREQSLEYVMSNFMPNSTIAMAYRSEE
ncbi:MAG: phosphotransferase [Anaerolineales bacterium]|nr:phosphotransferase [Anaerolineales bacterium]